MRAVPASGGGGYAVACGTGIEDCLGYANASSLLADCQAGTADARPGAYARQAGVWQSMLLRTDAAGSLLWQRVDQHRPAAAAELGAPGWVAKSSAAEYPIVGAATGKLISVNDEVDGVGVYTLATP